VRRPLESRRMPLRLDTVEGGAAVEVSRAGARRRGWARSLPRSSHATSDGRSKLSEDVSVSPTRRRRGRSGLLPPHAFDARLSRPALVTRWATRTGDTVDGYRVQAHKMGSRVVVYSRNGHDFTERFPSIAELLRELPAKAAVLDGEVVASDTDGRP